MKSMGKRKSRDSLFPLFLAAHLTDMGLSGVFLALPMLGERAFNTSVFELAILWCVGAGVYFIFAPMAGWLAGRIGTGKLVLVGAFGMSATYLLLGLTRTLGQLYIARLLVGVACAMFWPSLEAEIAHGADRGQLRRRMGRFNLSWSTGGMVGFYLAGVLFRVGWRLPFFCFAALQLVPAVMLLRWGGLRFKALTPLEPEKRQPTSSGKARSKGPNFMLLALVANFGTWSVSSMTLGIFPDLATAKPLPNMNSLQVGILWGVMGCFRTLVFLLFSGWHWWTHRLGFFFAIQGLALAGAMTIFTQDSFWGFVPAFIMLGMGVGLTYYYSIFHSIHSGSNRALGAGIHEAVLGLGGLSVPLLAGKSADLVSETENPQLHMRMPYLVGAAVVVLCLVVQLIIIAIGHAKRKSPRNADAPTPARS